MTEARVRVGIIGLSAGGGWASRSHLPALRDHSGFELVALSTSNEESARAAGAAHGVELAFGDHRELVSRPEVDLVVVAVRVPAHLELVEAAAAAGKDVFCEWPLGRDLAEAELMRDMAAAAGVRGLVGLQARSLPVIRFIADHVAAGELGEILSTTLVGSGKSWGAGVAPANAYLLDRANGATMLSIPVGHTLDAVCRCLGEPTDLAARLATRRPSVEFADGTGTVPMTAADQVILSGRLESGAVMSLHYRGGMSPGTDFLWEIEGTRGTLALSGASGHLQHGEVSLSAGPPGEQLRPLEIPATYVDATIRCPPPAMAVAYAYAAIFEDLRHGSGRAPTFADAVVRHRTLEAIELSASAPGDRNAADRDRGHGQ